MPQRKPREAKRAFQRSAIFWIQKIVLPRGAKRNPRESKSDPRDAENGPRDATRKPRGAKRAFR